ncbi:MAG: NADH-quinone oxidoreductase subunit A [Deltaproteobacteria bacterium]|nr:MAG: NADH-quinone oxidoreductase subunit A [Deltaproteobacteria bacterium]
MEPNFTEFLYRDTVLWIFSFTLGGLAFALGPIAIVYLFMPLKTRQVSNRSLQCVECGMEPIGDSWIRYGVVFYLYALIFLVFDVDILFLFPAALAYNNEMFQYRDLVELIIFTGILFMAVVYAWRKGVFTWKKKTYLRPW